VLLDDGRVAELPEGSYPDIFRLSTGGNGPIEPITVYDTTTGQWMAPTTEDLTNWVLLATDVST
jgi:hypothetical protein